MPRFGKENTPNFIFYDAFCTTLIMTAFNSKLYAVTLTNVLTPVTPLANDWSLFIVAQGVANALREGKPNLTSRIAARLAQGRELGSRVLLCSQVRD